LNLLEEGGMNIIEDDDKVNQRATAPAQQAQEHDIESMPFTMTQLENDDRAFDTFEKALQNHFQTPQRAVSDRQLRPRASQPKPDSKKRYRQDQGQGQDREEQSEAAVEVVVHEEDNVEVLPDDIDWKTCMAEAGESVNSIFDIDPLFETSPSNNLIGLKIAFHWDGFGWAKGVILRRCVGKKQITSGFNYICRFVDDSGPRPMGLAYARYLTKDKAVESIEKDEINSLPAGTWCAFERRTTKQTNR